MCAPCAPSATTCGTNRARSSFRRRTIPARRLVKALAAQGIAAQTESAIVPILAGDERRAVEMAAKLETRGFLVPAIRYPTVAKGAARLRVSVSARTTEEDLRALAAVLAKMMPVLSPRNLA